jgi:hypothetical protein
MLCVWSDQKRYHGPNLKSLETSTTGSKSSYGGFF